MTQRQVQLTSEAFETFLRSISILQDVCTDADIQQGFLRQRTNDRSTIFEIDLSPIIEDMTFPLIKLKSKVSLLKLLRGSDVTIEINDDNLFTFYDQFSKFSFRNNPNTEYIDNRFMTEDELNNLFSLNDDDIILSADINQTLSNRIRVVKDVYNTNNIFVDLNGETASIYAKTDSNDQYATFVNEIMTEREMTGFSSLVLVPFTIDHDGDINMKMFNYDRNISINKFDTSIESVDITLYSRSEIVQEDED